MKIDIFVENPQYLHAAVFTPSQGFFNFLVYVRPRLIKYFEAQRKKREGRRNSRTASSFNSDILHVSGMDSSNEMNGQTQNREGSMKSDLTIGLNGPFVKSKPDTDVSEQGSKVRFVASGRNLIGNVDKEESEEDVNMKVRFASSGRNLIQKDDEESEESRYPSKVRFGEKKVGTPSLELDATNTTFLDATSDSFLREKSESEESQSEGTIDPDLLLPDVMNEVESKESSSTEEDMGKGVVGLIHSTIDFATGEVRTRRA